MKNKQPPVEAAEVKKEPEASVKPEVKTDPVFTVEQLRPSARTLFGISQSTYDGATASIDGEQMFTVDEMRKHIDKWLKEVY